MRLTASLVLYDNPAPMFEAAIDSFLGGSAGLLVIADNSPVPLVSPAFTRDRVRYLHMGTNLGFGRAHNRAFAEVARQSDAHLILNPDIVFGPDVLAHLTGVIERQPEVGAIMPQIRYPSGEIQRAAKLLPTPIDIFTRRFSPSARWREAVNDRYELRALSQTQAVETPTLSGCFLIVRSALFADLGGFDPRYFMYMEDYDLVRRIGDRAVTLYDPTVVVEHAHGRGSYRSRTLLKAHIRSAIAYFHKWGWARDATRRARNAAMRARIAHGAQAR